MTCPDAGKLVRACVLTLLIALPCTRVVAADAAALESSRSHAQVAESLQLLGKQAKAIAEYRQALALAEQGADPAWQALLLGQLGGALLTAGQLDEAETVLNRGLENAKSLNDAGLQASLTNNLAHLLKARGDTAGALSRFRECFLLARRAGNPALQAKASLGAAETLLASGQDAGNVEILLDQAWQAASSLPPSRSRAWLAIHNAQALQKLAEGNSNATQLLSRAAQRLLAAAEMADALGDSRTASYAWGYLGGLYEQQQRYAEALSLTGTAVFMAQQVQAPELRFRWEWQQGRILAAQGKPDAALESYRRATATLQSIRAELTASNETIAAAFREDASPLFLELADLLLRQSETQPDREREQALLRRGTRYRRAAEGRRAAGLFPG